MADSVDAPYSTARLPSAVIAAAARTPPPAATAAIVAAIAGEY